jgi:phosphate-selective porin OprO/OprP
MYQQIRRVIEQRRAAGRDRRFHGPERSVVLLIRHPLDQAKNFMRTVVTGFPACFARAAICGSLFVVHSLSAAPCLAADEATEARIRQLEEKLESVTRELQELKTTLPQAGVPVVDRAPASVAPAAPAAAKAVEDPAATRQFEALQKEIADVRDQAATTESRVDQVGVRAYLGPGLVFEDPRGRWRFQLSGRTQLDFRSFAPSFANVDTFSIRRARIGASATILDDYYLFVEEEFANQTTSPAASNAPIMTFAFIDLQWFRPGLRFRLGQFKPFMGLDNTQLDMQTDFLERGFTQSLFQNAQYDRGAMVFGEPIRGLFYSAAVTNGAGQNVDESQANLQEASADGKDVTLRGVANFAQFLDLKDAVIHFGGTFRQGTSPNSSTIPFRAATVQTEARGLTFFIPAPFNAAGSSVSNIRRSIYGLEGALAFGPYKVQGDYIEARYEGTTHSGTLVDFDRSLRAAYLSAGWMLTGEYYSDIYRDGTFLRPRPNNNFRWGESGATGLWELNLRYSWFDGKDFAASNPANTGRPGTSTSFPNITTGTSGATAWTLGLKWQPNLYARMVLNLIRTGFDTPVTVNGMQTSYERAITLRAQLDF